MASRKHYIDWLRVLAVLLLFDFHTARIFDEGGFYIKTETPSMLFEVFVLFVNNWHMPIFFLVSGVGTYYALGRRSGREYAIERMKRLLVPFVFGTLVIVPPQVYYKLRSGPGYDLNYFQFYPDFFHGVAPTGNFEYGHLWFLLYLFVFSMILLPLFLRAGTEPGKKIIDRLAGLAARPGGIFLLALPVMVLHGALREAYPDGMQNLYADWANFTVYITLFGYGFLLCADPRFEEAIDRSWKIAAVLVVILTVSLFAIGLSGLLGPDGYSVRIVVFDAARAFTTWTWLIFFLGAAKRFLNFGGRVLDYANQAVLPLYVLHQTAIIVIGFYVLKLDSGDVAKFIYIDLAAFFAALFIYDALIKRWNPLRFLFGMRVKAGKEPGPEQTT